MVGEGPACIVPTRFRILRRKAQMLQQLLLGVAPQLGRCVQHVVVLVSEVQPISDRGIRQRCGPIQATCCSGDDGSAESPLATEGIQASRCGNSRRIAGPGVNATRSHWMLLPLGPRLEHHGRAGPLWEVSVRGETEMRQTFRKLGIEALSPRRALRQRNWQSSKRERAREFKALTRLLGGVPWCRSCLTQWTPAYPCLPMSQPGHLIPGPNPFLLSCQILFHLSPHRNLSLTVVCSLEPRRSPRPAHRFRLCASSRQDRGSDRVVGEELKSPDMAPEVQQKSFSSSQKPPTFTYTLVRLVIRDCSER